MNITQAWLQEATTKMALNTIENFLESVEEHSPEKDDRVPAMFRAKPAPRVLN